MDFLYRMLVDEETGAMIVGDGESSRFASTPTGRQFQCANAYYSGPSSSYNDFLSSEGESDNEVITRVQSDSSSSPSEHDESNAAAESALTGISCMHFPAFSIIL